MFPKERPIGLQLACLLALYYSGAECRWCCLVPGLLNSCDGQVQRDQKGLFGLGSLGQQELVKHFAQVPTYHEIEVGRHFHQCLVSTPVLEFPRVDGLVGFRHIETPSWVGLVGIVGFENRKDRDVPNKLSRCGVALPYWLCELLL